MPIEMNFIRPAGIALSLAALAACHNPSHLTQATVSAADKAAEKANLDALKGFSSGTTPAWGRHRSHEKPVDYAPWEDRKVKESKNHE